MRADVVVVGAGISGLTCARALTDAGLSVVVLEGRPDIGGRIRSIQTPDGGPIIELGAQVVHGDANPIHDLFGDGDLDVVPREVPATVVLGGERRPMSALARWSRPPWTVQAQLTATPGTDDVSVATWLDAQGLTTEHGTAAREWLRQYWGVDPGELGAQGVAEAERAEHVGDGEYAIRGGFDRLPRLLGQGIDIRCGAAVRSIKWSPRHVVVQTDDVVVTAPVTVITIPPAVIATGEMKIDLPEPKTEALRRLGAGDAYCSILTMSRLAPADAIVLDLDGNSGFVRSFAGRPEVLVVAKAGAAQAMRSVSAAARREVIGRGLPWVSGAAIQDVVVADWGRDPFSRGAFCHPLVAGCDVVRTWAEPMADTLFFAGEATVVGSGLPWVHGAAASGMRAAQQLLGVVTA